MKGENDFYKRNEADKIWWKRGIIGEWLFSFDKKKVYNMFRDYPHNMSKKEVELFDTENPYWAEYFKDRREK